MTSLSMNTKKLVIILIFLLSFSFVIKIMSLQTNFDFYLLFYLQTATCFRIAKQFDQAKECLMKAADCHKENRSLFHAARCFEQVCTLQRIFKSICTLLLKYFNEFR